MAPLLTALIPFLLLPALLAVLGHAAAPAFGGFAAALFLLVVAARIAIGVARLPLLCLGGIAALGAAAMPLVSQQLGWPPAAALAVVPAAGLLAGILVWLLIRDMAPVVSASLTLLVLLLLAALPAITADVDLPMPALDGTLLWPLGVAAILLVLAERFAASPLVRLHEAAREAGLPLAGLGVDPGLLQVVACLLAGALAALGGALLGLGPVPVIGIAAADWATLSIACFAIGRLGGIRLGGALLAALPLALLPKLIVTIAPGFVDLTLAAALAASCLHLVVRRDGSPAWRGSAETPPLGIGAPRLAER
jgi:ABC-type branched-subunit amino acid transport system permease subunit